ncbi:rna-directed dna polymerase from mobile element jockey-like [Willisornis vidua]|uniref:Rna-directed dna polymerase from mobile element jockey-like n=1 Tax=Willisornis vidua TaxID=1566151 RepID=A0ABQ9CR34_9PASS|nr:rna-directed dna polymerase from mobile element jockey-like [Willisornis vidua]
MLCLMPPRTWLALLAARALLNQIQLAIDQDPNFPFHSTAFQHLITRVAPSQSWEFGKVPADWNLKNIIPIFKMGRKYPRNYRPVSLPSATDEVIKCTLSKFTDHTKLGGSADFLEDKKALKRNLDRLDGSAGVSNMRFYKAKWWVLHFSHSNSMQGYRLKKEQLESTPAEKDLQAMVSCQLNMRQQCAQVAMKANSVLAMWSAE